MKQHALFTANRHHKGIKGSDLASMSASFISLLSREFYHQPTVVHSPSNGTQFMPPAVMVSHTSLDSILLELSWALFALTLVVLILRFIGELFIVRSFKLASWMALLAFVSSLMRLLLDLEADG